MRVLRAVILTAVQSLRRLAGHALFLKFAAILLFVTNASAQQSVLVGRGLDVRDVMIPGPELKVRKSRGLADPIVLRIAATYQHGTAGFRYDFHCIPMVAGKHDLTQFLETPDGQPAKGLAPVVVEATGVLPAGPPGMLKEPGITPPPRLGGYAALIPYGIALWVLAGIAGFWYFRKPKSAALSDASMKPPTLAERLKPLLERAISQQLGTPEKAELERLLIAHGRERLGLAGAAEPAVWLALRNDPSTASWLATLENWLHRPATSPPSADELRELLARISPA